MRETTPVPVDGPAPHGDPASDTLRLRVEELEREVAELRRTLSDERGASWAVEVRNVDAAVDRSGARALLLQAAQAELQASEERYRTIVDTTDEGIWTTDAEMVTTFANTRIASMLGCVPEEMIGRSVEDFVDESSWEETRKGFERRRQGIRERHELGLRRKDGTVFWVSIAASPLQLPDGRFAGSLAMVTDVTEQRQAEEVRARLAAIVESSEDAIFAKSLDGTILTWNSGAQALFGYTPEEAIGQSAELLIPPDQREELFERLERLRAGQSVSHIEMVRRRKDGSDVVVALSISPLRDSSGQLIGASTISRDITQRRNLEEQLRQSQKLEAVGRLAGGVAHDFNNLLTAILGYSDILAERFKVGDPERAEIQEIRLAGERAAALTRQLLAFSRKQVLVPEALDLGRIVRGLAGLLERLIGEHIRVSVIVAPGLGQVLADPGQMEQVVMNLALNARDAMPRGGELLLEVKNVDLDETYAGEHMGAIPGPYVLLAVSDTGVGMSAEIRKHAFEPFFTTKPAGEGTGLGLATVHGIVNQSGGTIGVYSEPGRGTTFKIHLPRIPGSAREAHPLTVVAGPVQGTGTILLIEDDGQLRRLARIILERSGYLVLEAKGPEEALVLGRGHDGPIDLLLTDVVMPGMSGPEVAALLLKDRPDLPVLYMSGYTDDAIVHHGVLNPGTEFMQKPFTPHRLGQRVQEVMRQRR